MANQSRITFSGQRGLVMVFFSAQLQNQASAVKDGVGLQIAGTAVTFAQFTAIGVMHGLVNERMSGVLMVMLLDPPAGSFIEAVVRMSAGTVNFTANDGVVSGLSFGHSADEGPTVTVS